MATMETLPIVGEITLKVRLMRYDKIGKGGNRDGEYHCGFAHFRYQDCISTVYDDTTKPYPEDDAHKQGTIGATMGGHHFMSREKPNQKAYSDRKPGSEWIDVIIDNRDIWYAIERLLNTPEAQAALMEAARRYPEERKRQREEAARKEEKRKQAALKKEQEKLDAEEQELKIDNLIREELARLEEAERGAARIEEE